MPVLQECVAPLLPLIARWTVISLVWLAVLLAGVFVINILSDPISSVCPACNAVAPLIWMLVAVAVMPVASVAVLSTSSLLYPHVPVTFTPRFVPAGNTAPLLVALGRMSMAHHGRRGLSSVALSG